MSHMEDSVSRHSPSSESFFLPTSSAMSLEYWRCDLDVLLRAESILQSLTLSPLQGHFLLTRTLPPLATHLLFGLCNLYV